jgi:nucleoside-diphosphate-sugar epimerase
MNGKIVLVTGGTGFLGREIVKILIGKGYNVKVLTRSIGNRENTENIEYVEGDITDLEALKNVAKNCYGIIHSAAAKTVSKEMEKINVVGTTNIAIAANEAKVKSFCNISTVSVVGVTSNSLIDETIPLNPTNQYETTKHDAEKAFIDTIDADIISSVVIRPSRIFGKGEITYKNSFLPFIKRWIKGNEQANYVYVKDVAAAAVYFIDNDKRYVNEIFNVSDNSVENNFKTIYKLVNDFYNRKTTSVYPTIMLPYFLRKIRRGKANIGNKKYDSNKLINAGFKYPYGLKNAVTDALNG